MEKNSRVARRCESSFLYRLQDIASQCIGAQVTSSPSQALLLFDDYSPFLLNRNEANIFAFTDLFVWFLPVYINAFSTENA